MTEPGARRPDVPLHRFPLAGHAAAAFAGYCALALLDLTRHVPIYLALHGLLALLAFDAARRAEAAGRGFDLRFALWAALAFRAPMLLAPPVLSDDLYRYLWDGRVLLSGTNPFAYAPDAPALAALRDAAWTRINHPEIPTIYPPLAQAAFALAGRIAPGPLGLKTLWALLDAGTIALLADILRRTGRPPGRALFYAWSPLAVVEVAGSGHVDVLGVFLVALAVRLSLGGRPRGAIAALAAAGLAKLMPFALLARPLRDAPRTTLALGGGLALAAYLPFAGAGGGLFAGLRAYGEHWRFAPILYDFAFAALGDGSLARLALLLGWAGALLWAVSRRYDLERTALWFLGAYLLATPTLHPWYALWVLPWAALRRSWAWLLFAAAAPLSYSVFISLRAEGTWAEPTWTRWALLAALGAGWALDQAAARAGRIEARPT